MEQPVIISVKGIQTGELVGEEKMEFVTQGILEQDDSGFALHYRETDITGMEGTLTTFRVGGNRIILHREGAFNSEMIFEVGQKHLSAYETPFGGLVLGVDTRVARVDFDQNGGELFVQYHLDIDNEMVGENSFELHVTRPRLPTIAQ